MCFMTLVESKSQYVQKSAEHTLEKPRHKIDARYIWTGSDRKHTIRDPRPRRMTSVQSKCDALPLGLGLLTRHCCVCCIHTPILAIARSPHINITCVHVYY